MVSPKILSVFDDVLQNAMNLLIDGIVMIFR